MAELPDVREKLSGKDKELYERMLARRETKGAGLRGPYVPLMNHPELASRVEELGFYLKFESTLPRDVYQFIVLTMSRCNNVAFEWIDHEEKARAAGLPEDIIEALRNNACENLPDRYALVHRALYNFRANKSLDEDVQDALKKEFGIKGLIEVAVLIGFYDLIGIINQGFAVPLPKGAKKPF